MRHLRPPTTANALASRLNDSRRPLWALLASLPLLGACSETLPLSPPSQKPAATPGGKAATPVAQEQPLRIVVRFRTAVPYQDAAYLQGLGQQVRAELRYVASVSPDTHVYLLQAQAGQASTDILKRLASQPAVLWVEPDRRASPL